MSKTKRYPLDKQTGLSRQRRWQLARVADGKCHTCGKPRGKKGSGQFCYKHRLVYNAYQNARNLAARIKVDKRKRQA